MNIAVTGATGLIGTALVADLRADGHRVIRVVRGAPPAGDPDVARWDPIAGTIDAAALDGLDGVVHLAGQGIGDKRWTPAQKQRILESRTLGTALLARTLAAAARPARGARLRIGGRLVRESRRRSAHRGQPTARTARLRRRRVPAVGSRH